MSKRIQRVIISLSALILAVFVGCSAFQEAVTPTLVSREAAALANEPIKLFNWMPYTTLLDAKRISAKLRYKRTVDDMKYGFYQNITDLSIIGGEQFKQTVFSPEGGIAPILYTALGGTLGGLLIKRPGDKSKKEVETEIKLNGKEPNVTT